MLAPDSVAKPLVNVDEGAREELIRAAQDNNTVSGLTHNFYRYPARFSPVLVRAAINAFTRPGDFVLDPFVGGGTTLVEALAAGRNAIGSDISSLATFVSDIKTTVFDEWELLAVEEWGDEVMNHIDMHSPCQPEVFYLEAGYLRNLGGARTWRIRKAIVQALHNTKGLSNNRLEGLARCGVLRTAQWALDGKRAFPSVGDFRKKLREFVYDMTDGARKLAAVVKSHGSVKARCLNRPTAGMDSDPCFLKIPSPRLIITSPPYPGVHVLYHRWQIQGGKETAAPFWIANQLDGAGAAYYTMGHRGTHAAGKYFYELRAALKSVVALCDRDTTVVQVVAFSEPAIQLGRYLSVADEVGLEEHVLANNAEADKRLWRTVPNRKWYASQRGSTSGSQEVVLFHKLRK